jgi:probable F420-dependent oxidoreductase
MRIGAKVPNSGQLPATLGIGTMAAELERAGFDSLWVSDHVVMPAAINSPYPFAADGKPTWPSDVPYFDAMIALAMIAAQTQKVSIGTAVLVLPQRNPVILAKQAASIDVLSGGRLILGIGAGWLAEEFDALNVPFDTRGQRFTEWVELLRRCWTGTPDAFDGQHYRLPAGILAMPPPEHEIPLLVGGHSRVAIARAATIGNGWLAQQSALALDTGAVQQAIVQLRQDAGRAGRDPDALRVAIRIVDSASRMDALAAVMPQFVEAGVDEVIVDTDWAVAGSAAAAHDQLRNAALR